MPPLTAQPLAQSKELDPVHSDLPINVNPAERVASAAAGIALMAYGLSRRSLTGVFITLGGAALLLRGGSGHCMLYERLGINSHPLDGDSEF